MNIPLIDLRAQYMELKDEIWMAMQRVLDSGVYISGAEVTALENDIASITNAKYAVSVANGTDALVLALDACGIGPGDEVITSPFTFFATAEAIARRGATPVFADIDEHTFNLSPEHAAAQITARTKAIIPVHLFGQPADMDAFKQLAEQHKLAIIEDACQALGAAYKGNPVGAMGTIGCISFFPTKNLGGYGDGGIVITNDEEMADRVRLLSHHGSKQKYIHNQIGYNSRLDPLQAAVLRVKLRKLDEWNKRRQKAAAYYAEHLDPLLVTPPIVANDVSHVFHLYVLKCHNRSGLAEQLKQAGIATGHYYPSPLHLQKALAYLGYKEGDFMAAESMCRSSLALPISPHITMEEQKYIVKHVNRWTKG